ncbi:hypothetical protein OUZ56_025496 [Daphnia magna]|uniref:Uncharacterized protein n=1 Tax=Daphnia magna TaxID=35525 RepID=A0ABQ9ZK10_9CRUS|nr:hypothetical protein OUZ56_025496 [Daphnia magna]
MLPNNRSPEGSSRIKAIVLASNRDRMVINAVCFVWTTSVTRTGSVIVVQGDGRMYAFYSQLLVCPSVEERSLVKLCVTRTRVCY